MLNILYKKIQNHKKVMKKILNLNFKYLNYINYMQSYIFVEHFWRINYKI